MSACQFRRSEEHVHLIISLPVVPNIAMLCVQLKVQLHSDFLWRSQFQLLIQILSDIWLSKNYIHQIACYFPSGADFRADFLRNDISAKHSGYACVLANVLKASTQILSEPKFTSDRVRVLPIPFRLLHDFVWVLSIQHVKKGQNV